MLKKLHSLVCINIQDPESTLGTNPQNSLKYIPLLPWVELFILPSSLTSFFGVAVQTDEECLLPTINNKLQFLVLCSMFCCVKQRIELVLALFL